MNRNNGLVAGMVVVLALLGVSNLPNKNSEGTAAVETKKSALPTAATARDSKFPYSPCTEIAKRLRRFVTDKETRVESWQLPLSCYGTGGRPQDAKPVAALPGVHFAIATVSDPVGTHLPLMFDRIVETIQQAAQDDNYSYDSSWFPWDPTGKDYPLLGDQKAAEELQDIQQAYPGVMIFRRALHKSDKPYDGGLVIFLVGEQPTGGISDDQFANALAWINQLGGLPDDRELRILGPTFSGSLPSLQHDLDRYLKSSKGHSKIFVSSGTVSSDTGPTWFEDWLKTQRKDSYFRTAMESDSVMVRRFCQYLGSQGYDVNHVAFLSEDETAFGRAPKKDPDKVAVKPDDQWSPCNGATDLYYPRDIATLRSAYQQQSILNAAKSSSNNTTPSMTLRGDLSEPSTSNHDTVRSYGGQLTPLAQEAILLDIANRLSEREIQFIILRSTSSLDQIFLSEFLRRSYPGGRVVIDGADLLFNRGAEGRSLRGVMMLSPYPLLTVEQDWTSSLVATKTGGYRSFGEDTAEAVYIAARELFLDPQLSSDIPIHDYAPPNWALDPDPTRGAENLRPATWVSVIGRHQFWPLAVLNSYTMTDAKFNADTNRLLSSKLLTSQQREEPFPMSQGEPNPLRVPTVMWTFMIACFILSLLHFYFCGNGSIMGSPRARAYFAPIDRRQHPVLIALTSGLLAMLAIAVAAGSGLFSGHLPLSPFLDPRGGGFLAASVVLIAAIALLGCGWNYGLLPLCASGSPLKNTTCWRNAVSGMLVLGLATFLFVQLFLIRKLTPANGIPAYWRSVHLSSGVSGLLPQVLLIAGAYLWFWCTLRGLAHFGEDRPVLPGVNDLPKLEDGTSRMPMFSNEKAGVPIEIEALPMTGDYLVRLVGILGIMIGACAMALRGFWVRTLGERAFGFVIFFWICLYLTVMFADGIQTWRAWNELRQLLVYLDRLPLRRTLRALKGLAWGSIWKMSGNVLEERYRVISLQVESLRHLKNAITSWQPDNAPEADDRLRLILKVSACQDKLREFAKWFVTLQKNKPMADLKQLHEFQEELAATAGIVMKSILLPAWEKEEESLIFDRSGLVEKRGEESGAEVKIPTEKLASHVRAAEEFFILPYLAFIQNILGRIRTIALGSLWLFVGTTLAVSSYPFDPLNVLGGIFLAVFMIIGGLTVLVYSQMSRDATLSHITNTRPGQLGLDFWLRLLGFGIGPLIGLLTTLFPSITDFAFSWLQPGVEALK